MKKKFNFNFDNLFVLFATKFTAKVAFLMTILFVVLVSGCKPYQKQVCSGQQIANSHWNSGSNAYKKSLNGPNSSSAAHIGAIGSCSLSCDSGYVPDLSNTSCVIIDTIAPTITINAPIPINSGNRSLYSLSGTCSENGQIVNISFSDGVSTLVNSPICQSSFWTITRDMTSLADGVISIHASTSDVAGNIGSISSSTTATSVAQIQITQFTTAIPGYTNVIINKTIADGTSGYTYIVGSVSGELSTAKMVGASDAFIARLDPIGNVVWATQIGEGGKISYGQGVGIDHVSGKIYISGSTSGSINTSVNPAPQKGVKISDLGAYDGFLAQFDPTNGNISWVKQFGSIGGYPTSTVGLDIDSSGSIYVAGATSGTLQGAIKVSNAFKNDLFITKYTSTGVLTWTKQYGVLGSYDTLSVAILKDTISDNFYVAGKTTGAFSAGSKISGTNKNDGLLIKINTIGSIVWFRQYGSYSLDDTNPSGIVIDNSGYIYSAGYTSGTIGGATKVSSLGGTDAFITKHDSNSLWLWSNQFGAPGVFYSTTTGITINNTGTLYIIGQTTGAMPGASKTSDLNRYDAFISKCESSGGSVSTVTQFGVAGPYEMTASTSITSDGAGAIYGSGTTTGSLAAPKPSNYNYRDSFLVKIQ